MSDTRKHEAGMVIISEQEADFHADQDEMEAAYRALQKNTWRIYGLAAVSGFLLAVGAWMFATQHIGASCH